MSQGNGHILNQQEQPTFFRSSNGIRTTSTLDLFIASPLLQRNIESIKLLEISPVVKFQKLYYHLPIIAKFAMQQKIEKKELQTIHLTSTKEPIGANLRTN